MDLSKIGTVLYRLGLVVCAILFAFGFGFIGWLYGASHQIKVNYENTPEYQHWELTQNGYNYCPYCGEWIKRGDD